MTTFPKADDLCRGCGAPAWMHRHEHQFNDGCPSWLPVPLLAPGWDRLTVSDKNCDGSAHVTARGGGVTIEQVRARYSHALAGSTCCEKCAPIRGVFAVQPSGGLAPPPPAAPGMRIESLVQKTSGQPSPLFPGRDQDGGPHDVLCGCDQCCAFHGAKSKADQPSPPDAGPPGKPGELPPEPASRQGEPLAELLSAKLAPWADGILSMGTLDVRSLREKIAALEAKIAAAERAIERESAATEALERVRCDREKFRRERDEATASRDHALDGWAEFVGMVADLAARTPGRGYCDRCERNVVIDGHMCPEWTGVCGCNAGDPVFHSHYSDKPHSCARCGKCSAFKPRVGAYKITDATRR